MSKRYRDPEVGEVYRITSLTGDRLVKITQVIDCRVIFVSLDGCTSYRNIDWFYDINDAVLVPAYNTPLWRLLNE